MLTNGCRGITQSGDSAPRSAGDAGRVKRRSALVLTLVLAGAILSAFAVAGQTRAVASPSVLAVLAGRVELAHGSAAYAGARDGQTVTAGDRVRTGDTGHAVVTFFDGSTLDIGSATEVAIEAAASSGATVDLVISQAIGRTFSSVHKLVDPRSRYEIRTPSLVAAVRGTKFEVEVAADGSAAERTTEGLVAVSSAGAEVFVPAGAQTRATRGTRPAAPAPIPAPRIGLGSGVTPAHPSLKGSPGDANTSPPGLAADRGTTPPGLAADRGTTPPGLAADRGTTPPGLAADPGSTPSGQLVDRGIAPHGLAASPPNATSAMSRAVPPLTQGAPAQPGMPVPTPPAVILPAPTIVPQPAVAPVSVPPKVAPPPAAAPVRLAP